MPDVTRLLRIHGRVQGVGYRYSMVDRAEALGVRGWVRNTPDGAVEAMLQGAEETVTELIDWAKQGPLGARVTLVDVSEGTGQYSDFSIIH